MVGNPRSSLRLWPVRRPAGGRDSLLFCSPLVGAGGARRARCVRLSTPTLMMYFRVHHPPTCGALARGAPRMVLEREMKRHEKRRERERAVWRGAGRGGRLAPSSGRWFTFYRRRRE
eukprot:scaffold134087_cov34-Tisochrysis_lutea.AAC.3